MLVEKIDRLYRNLKDWETVDELGVEMHFPKEGVVRSPTASNRSFENWLPFTSQFRTMCLAPDREFRRILGTVREFRSAA